MKIKFRETGVMKAMYIFKHRIWMILYVSFIFLLVQTGCNKEDNFNYGVDMLFQISMPNKGDLKSASSIESVRSVILTVNSESPVQKKKIVFNFAGGAASIDTVISLEKAKNVKFNVDAFDENNIIQWKGDSTIDIEGDFALTIDMLRSNPQCSYIKRLKS